MRYLPRLIFIPKYKRILSVETKFPNSICDCVFKVYNPHEVSKQFVKKKKFFNADGMGNLNKFEW